MSKGKHKSKNNSKIASKVNIAGEAVTAQCKKQRMEIRVKVKARRIMEVKLKANNCKYN